ncbi:MutS-related protein [Oceanirhabdus seepicola]|uniref:DNA mismatch repair proteins mutS family domain-containing protein n=1 Tax=Oceanirhabdus seepicola TaxID=2828781 RepID=A0A9J6P0S2_9CLOT|nr:hypothetical protein [Oceanirhabdus seepicola]MCM1990139.1 hypothetical protein [Oceanirhabdus seepicola]
MRFLAEEQRKEVGFQYVLDSLNIITPFGMDEKKNIKPYNKEHKKLLQREFDIIEEIIHSRSNNERIYNEIFRQFMKIKDIRNTVKRCKGGECLDEVELFEIKIFSMICEEIRCLVCDLELNIEELALKNTEDVVELLDPQGKRMATFYVYEEYSAKLKEVRNKKRSIEEKIYKEKDLHNTQILKEERLEFVVQEEEEEWDVRKNLSEKIRAFCVIIEENIDKIGKLDLAISKTDIAKQYGGVKPTISSDMTIRLKDGINPEVVDLIKARNKGEFTPISIELYNGSTIITGANMGGKSITLKTIVLNLLLFQSGFYIFAKEGELPQFDFIYLISDDMQSISKGLSTFGAEIMGLKQITESVKRGDGFVAFDEFARGTNPFEGRNLVKVVTEFFHKFNSICLFATHYDGVVNDKMDHYQVKGLKDVNFEQLKRKIQLEKSKSVEIIQKHMDYRLERVMGKDSVPKDALNIAMLLGIDEEISRKIKELYGEEEEE